jgi:Flp pilus assembly protein TadG
VSARRLLARLRADRGGATALEFALVAPVLFTFVLGAFQVAWGLHCAATVRWALEKEARTVFLTPNTTADQLKTAMVADLNGIANAQSLAVTVAVDNSNPASDIINASSSFTYSLWIPFLPTQSLSFNAHTSVPAP